MKKILSLFILILIFNSCDKDDVKSDNPNNPIEVQDDLSGSLSILNGNASNYTVYSELDKAALDDNGNFDLKSNTLLWAKNNQSDKIVYLGIPSDDQSDYKLNAKETALFFALQAIPNFNKSIYRPYVDQFKSDFYDLAEVKELEKEIEKSVTEKGFLDYDVIGPFIGAAIDKIVDKIGFLDKTQTHNFNSPVYNNTYAAGKGYYRVSGKAPNGGADVYHENTQTYYLVREFFNSTPAIVGVKVEKYNYAENRVDLPFKNPYIGFVEPYYPPNLLSLEGTWDNAWDWGTATADIMIGGWDGLANTDAYSNSTILDFEAKAGEKDAFVFVNGYYDKKILAANVIHLMMNNISQMSLYDIDENTPIDDEIASTLMNSFLKWVFTNSTENLENYPVWFEEKQFDLIIDDLLSKQKAFLLAIQNEETQTAKLDDYFFNAAVDYVDNAFEDLAGAYGKAYKYSKKLYDVGTVILMSSSPNFASSIPMEFNDVVTQPPFPYKPYPFNKQIDPTLTVHFSWEVDNVHNQDLRYNFYLGNNPEQLVLVHERIKSNMLDMTGMQTGRRYYWKVDVINADNDKISHGAVWVFDNGYADFNDQEPFVYLTDLRNKTSNSIEAAARVTSEGGSDVTEYGFAYSTNPNPNIEDNNYVSKQKKDDMNYYVLQLHSLEPNTTYYVVPFAKNSIGVGYGNEKTFTTNSQNSYDLSLSTNSIEIRNGSSGEVTITQGSGDYTVTSNDTDIAVATLDNMRIDIAAVSIGSTVVTVIDNQSSQTQNITVEVSNTTGTGTPGEKVFVQGGTFTMGCTSEQSDCGDIESPTHQVTLSDFHIGKYEVTNAEYAAFLNEKGNQEEGGRTWLNINSSYCQIEVVNGTFKAKEGKENYPVIEVTWYGARAYCEWVGGRLPTEAEWEYAARGGNQSQGYKYSGSDDINEVAWYRDNSGSSTHSIGTKKVNELGIHDMSGNVWEWCDDWYGYYSSNDQTNPTGPSSGYYRLLRGGSWYNSAKRCRVASRSHGYPGSSSYLIGFRVVYP